MHNVACEFTCAEGCAETINANVVKLTPNLRCKNNCSIFAIIVTGAQPKAGTCHKMQSVPVVFERYIVRDITLI